MEKFAKTCPKCGKEQTYSNKYNLRSAVKAERLCPTCANKIVGENQRGARNPFWGKSHPPDLLQSIAASRDTSYTKDPAFLKKMSEVSSGAKNPMFGRSFYSVWVEKYGQDEADKRLAETKKKCSENTSGSKNPMFGRPAPQGSGNGWSGWMKGKFFRSLGELNFMIENEKWETGETIRIPYVDHEGSTRTYSPDFVVGSTVVECKPLKLQTSPSVLAKAAAAEEWCAERGLTYKIIDPGKPTIDRIETLVASGELIFLERYKEKLNEWISKNHPNEGFCRIGQDHQGAQTGFG